MAIMLGMLGAFFLGIIVVLYVTLKKSSSFDDYAVGGRSFGPWLVAMSYVNSWWPGTVFISFAGISVASGVFGFYGLAYSTLGLAAMYFIATRAWRWGKHYNLVTQPDLLRLRYGSKAVGVVTSIIGVVAILPWVILGMQALATVFSVASGGTWALPVCLLVGLATVLIRQIWTVRMGMRGLVYTDMYQGLVAYVIAAAVCVLMLVAPNSPANWSYLSELPNELLFLPGDGDSYGPLYMFSSVFTGVVGALCWPMSFVRIYTANNVKSVKKSTNYAMLIAGGFYALLTVVMLSAAHITGVAANPQAGWMTLLENYDGVWLLGLGLTMIFAGSIGHIDGSVQAAGTQIANDIVGSRVALTDKQKTLVSKGSMMVFIALAADGERGVVAGGSAVPGMAAVGEAEHVAERGTEREAAAGCAGAGAASAVASVMAGAVATCGNAAGVMIREEPASTSGGLGAGKVAGAVSAACADAAGCTRAGGAVAATSAV